MCGEGNVGGRGRGRGVWEEEGNVEEGSVGGGRRREMWERGGGGECVGREKEEESV